LLNDLKGAWLAIEPAAQASAPSVAPTPPINDALAPRMVADYAKA
jgi:hypothetical protein